MAIVGGRHRAPLPTVTLIMLQDIIKSELYTYNNIDYIIKN
jgi:hypothetical protein